MELRQLRYFAAVARHLHFKRAAAELHMAQPPLSQQIARLEAELGVRLFERTSRQVTLTAEGEQMLEAAERVLRGAEHVHELAERLAEGTAGKLRLGFVFPALSLGLSAELGAFRRSHPEINVQAIQIPNFELAQALRDDVVDLGVTMPHVPTEGIVEHHLSDHPIAVVLPSTHPRASDASVSLGDLVDETFIAPQMPSEGFHYDYILRACAEAGFVPKVLRHGPQLSVMMHMVAAGYGITLATESDQPAPGTVLRPLKAPGQTLPLSVVHSRRPLVPAAESFLHHITHSRMAERPRR